MKVIYELGKVKRIRHSAVALGVFDGLHRGHLRILRELVRFSQRTKATSLVVTFTPHPQRDLNLYSLTHRIELLQKIGIDICIVVKFTESFSRMSASNFVKNFLINKIHPEHVFVGKNFTFGKDAKGDPALLKKYADKGYFNLKTFPLYQFKGKAISSTYIRQLILRGKLLRAGQLLGRPVSILGRVIKGSSLARSLGFPTANIDADHEILPPAGVYAVRVILLNKKFKGICYIGNKPTFSKRKKSGLSKQARHIEAHIFGLKSNIYGKDLEIQFLGKIRKEKKFKSVKLLAEQVKKDIHLARLRYRN